MDNSPQFCREQAALHRAKAEDTSLPNIRRVAIAAAETWEREAKMAEMVLRRRARLVVEA